MFIVKIIVVKSVECVMMKGLESVKSADVRGIPVIRNMLKSFVTVMIIAVKSAMNILTTELYVIAVNVKSKIVLSNKRTDKLLQ